MVEKLKNLSLFNSQLSPEASSAIVQAPKLALEKIATFGKTALKNENGWGFSTKTGHYGTDYLQRAYVAFVGLGANLPQDAIYPVAVVDSQNQPLDGKHNYVIHFAKDKTPPVKGFWSLTMYNDQFFFVNNPLNRYTLSARNNLKYNADGSLDLTIQNVSPGKDKESNWLPAPAGPFVLMFRFYWPEESVIDGSWQPPKIEKVK